MIFLIAFFVVFGSSFYLAGVTAKVFVTRKLLIWLALPAAIFGSVLICFLAMLSLSYFGLVENLSPPTSSTEHLFASWVVTSWIALLGIPLAAAIGVIRVFEIKDGEH